MNDVKELVEELRNKKSRDNRDLLDRSADMIEKLAKELCEKSSCHHKCHDTKDCVVEDEAKEVISILETTTEKQIEEMAKIFCGMKNGCDGCMWDKVYCNERNYAEEIYNAGYRKQSEGEWIFKEYGEDTYTNLTRIYECSLCGRTIECLNEADEPYCHCGAKMTRKEDEGK